MNKLLSLLGFVIAGNVYAENLLDSIRGFDMNDYSLGVAVSVRENPYSGGENSTVAYPYLTSFTHPSMSDSWFIVRDSGYGFRWITDNDWEFGAIGRVRTLGLGNSDAEELEGIADRQWTIELGPTIGYRRWPLQIHYTHWLEVSGRHHGYTSNLALSYPIRLGRGYVVPRVHAIYENDEHTSYYFSVSEAEATPSRPAYEPGSTWNAKADVHFGYPLSPQWLLTASLGVEFLGPEITDSPIVSRDEIWFGSLGLAYNADIFNPADFDQYHRHLPTLDIRVGAFFPNINTTIKQGTGDGLPGSEIDLEDQLDAPTTGTAIEVEGLWRIGQHHRLEIGYFELVREARSTVNEDVMVGTVRLDEGAEARIKIDYSSLRFTYTFYLLRDSQKELGVMGGLHLTELETLISAVGLPDVEKSKSSAPLPVIGLNGAVFFGDKTSLRARIHVFRTDFDQYEGALNYASLELERRLGRTTSLGLGYNFYGTRLSSRDSGARSNLEIEHHGPVIYFTAGF